MRESVYEYVPEWIKNPEKDMYVMVGDDIDSVATAGLLREYLGWEINWFYDFNKVYSHDTSIRKKQRVGVDMALEMNEKTIDNHVTLLSDKDKVNPNSVNLNNMFRVCRGNYTDKYAMSTLLTAWSVLGIPLPSTDEGKKILLAIDSSYMGHYNKAFKETHNEWLRVLGFEELIEFLDEKTNEIELNIDIKKRYNIDEKVWLNEKGQLMTNLDLEGIGRYLEVDLQLPLKKFTLAHELDRKNTKLELDKNYKKKDKVYSFALTYRNLASFTTL